MCTSCRTRSSRSSSTRSFAPISRRRAARRHARDADGAPAAHRHGARDGDDLAVARDVLAGARHHHRQCIHSHHRGRSRGDAQSRHVDHHVVRGEQSDRAAARVIQGAAAGPMVPLSQSLRLGNYPEHIRGLALAFWAMTTTVAPITGPFLGGCITDNVSWPWIFYINVPVGLLCAYATWRLLKERETPTRRLPIDTVGLVLLVIGVGSLQVMLDKGNDLDWFGSDLIIV